MRPGKRILREAADLLACCASQPESSLWWFIGDMPGSWSKESRRIAIVAWNAVEVRLPDAVVDLVWREYYAEAEANIRKRLEAM